MTDLEKIPGVLIETAEQFILPRYKALQDHEISTKTGPRDLVTQADIEAEEYLEKVLPQLYPGSVVVGEEGVSSGKVSLDDLKNPGMIWVVDPVDGTHNFVHGKREFGIMLALVKDGETVAGWIYDILGKEMTVAERGAGAFSGEKRLKVSEPDIKALRGFMGHRFFPKEQQQEFEEARKKLQSWQPLNCAAHEYLRVAKGEADFALYNRLKPWDHLAGTLMVQEAGGYAAKWDGTPYLPTDSGPGLVASASKEVWDLILKVFIKKII